MPTITQAKADLAHAQDVQMTQQHRLNQAQQAVNDAVADLKDAVKIQIDNATNPQKHASDEVLAADIALVNETQALLEDCTRSLSHEKIRYDDCRSDTEYAKQQLHKVNSAKQERLRVAEQQRASAEADARERAVAQQRSIAQQQEREQHRSIAQAVMSQLSTIATAEYPCVSALMASVFHFTLVQSQQLISRFALTEQNVRNFLVMIDQLSCVYNLNQNSLLNKLNELPSFASLVDTMNKIQAQLARQADRENTRRTVPPTKKRKHDDENNVDNSAEHARASTEPDTSWQQQFNQISINFIMNKIEFKTKSAEIMRRHAMINNALHLGLSSNKILDCLNTTQDFKNLQLQINQHTKQHLHAKHHAPTASLPSASQLSRRASSAPLSQSLAPALDKRSIFHIDKPLSTPRLPQPTPANPSPTPNNSEASPAHFRHRPLNSDLDASLPNLPSPGPMHRNHSTPAAYSYNNGQSPLPSPPSFNTPRANRYGDYGESPVRSMAQAMSALSPTSVIATQQPVFLASIVNAHNSQ